MPDAARISDFHACPKVEPGPVPHVGGPIFSGSANVIIGFLPAARVGDAVVCFPVGPVDKVSGGSTSVFINHRAAARKTDPGAHGSRIVGGCPTVIIGDSRQSFALRAAARRGTPFCEECARKRQQLDDRDNSAEPEPGTATLDDDAPPVGARLGRDQLQGVSSEREALAAQPDQGDALDPARRAARVALAYQFYAAHGTGRLKPSKITSHIRGIDLSRPVEVIPVSGQTLFQRGLPGAGNGQYFALDPSTPPEQLGASSLVYALVDGVPTPPPVPRDSRVIAFGDVPAFGLKSTAAAITDTWSMPAGATDPGEQVACEGGGTQVMIPAKFHHAIVAPIPGE